MASPARVRVFVPTFRRPPLLRRALESLRAQTLTDWRCDVLNDDPSDDGPARLLRELGDDRIRLHTHAENLGPVATFNAVYRPTAEPYCALLEDDNWWQPEFLAVMTAELEARPAVTLAWCNQRVWEERPDGTWRDTGRLVRAAPGAEPGLEAWGDARQALGALHANGSMLLRSRADRSYPTPPAIPFSAVEPWRERMVEHPLLFVPAALANFAVTRSTSRARDRGEWTALQAVLLATFVRHAPDAHVLAGRLWQHYRAQRPAPVNVFAAAALISRDCRLLVSRFGPVDILAVARWLLRHPAVAWRTLRVRARHPDWWHGMDQHTARRWSDSAARQEAAESRGAR